MFKMQLAQYISDNMVRHHLSYKDISARSGVPQTTLSYYARGQVNTPNDDYCVRIAAVFGDGPEVINEMRRAALPSTAAENKTIAKANDVETAERLAAIMRTNMFSVLGEFKTETESEYIRRLTAVRSQYEDYIKSVETRCQERIDLQRQHAEELLRLERENAVRLHDQDQASKLYLKTVVRNLSTALAVTSTLAVAFGLYSVFAYKTFDVNDPTQGLARNNLTAAPFVVLLIIACVLVFFGGKFIFAKKAFIERSERK